MEVGPRYFFSIIIPAHNEEAILPETLRCVQELQYPKEKYETIVVENGSTDATLSVAHSFEHQRVKVLQSEKGVSRAKNTGIRNISTQSDWIIFLDADTILLKDFLQELNAYLQKHAVRGLAVGTTSVRPFEKSIVASLWFAYHNFVHRLSRISFAIQILRTPLIKEVHFDEARQFGEDLRLIRDARRFGGFFFLQTRSVLTSTRRFSKVGWVKQLMLWTWQGLILTKTSRKSDTYPVVR